MINAFEATKIAKEIKEKALNEKITEFCENNVAKVVKSNAEQGRFEATIPVPNGIPYYKVSDYLSLHGFYVRQVTSNPLSIEVSWGT